jgi:hypothetical protein
MLPSTFSKDLVDHGSHLPMQIVIDVLLVVEFKRLKRAAEAISECTCNSLQVGALSAIDRDIDHMNEFL